MRLRMAARLVRGLLVAISATGLMASAKAQDKAQEKAQEKKIKIGVVFDLTGPLAGGGSELNYVGAKIILDHFAKTGVEGYKIEAVYADAQSKPDIAINESVRLLDSARDLVVIPADEDRLHAVLEEPQDLLHLDPFVDEVLRELVLEVPRDDDLLRLVPVEHLAEALEDHAPLEPRD